jgi:diguanylate cyclase (GGDEF)-like protein
MIFPKKILIAFLAGIIALGALLFFHHFSEEYFLKRQIITEQIDTIETSEKRLDYLVLRSGFFLYLNQDEIIHQIAKVDDAIHLLRNEKHLGSHHHETMRRAETYNRLFQEKAEQIYDFQTANASIKNATMVISTLKQRALGLFNTSNEKERLFLEQLTASSISVLLAKNSLDGELLNHLEEDITAIESYRFDTAKKQNIATSLIQNLKVFRDFFPQYKEALERIEHSSTNTALAALRKSFLQEDHSELSMVTYFSYFLLLLYISSLGLIIYFLIRSEIDARTDTLTGLGNRKAFELFIRNHTTSTLFLININKFKNYNDFYGTAFGDRILNHTAHFLIQLCNQHKTYSLFRLGGDEFGVVYSHSQNINPETISNKILEAFRQNFITIDGIDITISVSIAISSVAPLLETADMAQKEIKKDRAKNFIIYHEGLNLKESIQSNIHTTHELKQAIENDSLFPYFQPIISLQSGDIEKYEALARIRTKEGEIKSIVDYLDILKESKLYPTLTRTMIQKSCEAMKDKVCDFSINLSIEDIGDPTTVEIIQWVLAKYPGIEKRVVFEILESEAVDDYQKIAGFIQKMKSYGCRIAIDDFGSGYSNFAHILNLDIDIIKLDGSLIRHLSTNQHAVMIVETIIDFARKAGIKTVAEFVSDEEIFNAVKKLGIDYAQGYYTGKPEPL